MSVAVLTGIVVAASTSASASAAPAPVPGTERVTLTASGEQADGDAHGPEVSADGRFAAFSAYAANLVPGDTNGHGDVFVRHLRTGTVERVSVGTGGAQADGESSALGISADGRYVLFRSNARNLVAWDTPPTDDAAYDIYLHDRRTHRTERISVAPDGGSALAGGAALSADARYIAFNAKADRMETDPGDLFGAVYVLDRRTGTVERVSNRTGPTVPAVLQGISADGRRVAYAQPVPRSGYGATWVHDRRTDTEERVNVRPDGTSDPWYAMPASLSADGRVIAFTSYSEDLVPGGAAGDSHLYVRDLDTDVTRRVAPGPAGESLPGAPHLSPDGRYLAYEAAPRQSDGLLGPSNVYLRDLRTGSTRLVSESVDGGPVTDAAVTLRSVSAQARSVGLGSHSARLVPGDTNGFSDGFVRHLR
ncbi:hypothetical protein SUDANB145_02117 [Streptomyces sp. enrichment culture]|uniref:TolB family protein n=1 Tax=Streptomyces sp. enrichment culture TaxID=1795815 RepID=UPI003F5742BC